MSSETDLYFRQIALGDMANLVYLIGSVSTRQCLIVDPAWDIDGLLGQAQEDGMEVVGALATHYHQDHIGGKIFGMEIQGLDHLQERNPVPVHVNKLEADGTLEVCELSRSDLVEHDPGDVIELGGVRVTLLHTPGHTPGSQCFLVEEPGKPEPGVLVSGDTLFLGSCGRVDLPGSNPEDMYKSIHTTLGRLPDETWLFPGHLYSENAHSTMGEQKQTNPFLRVTTLEQFLGFMGVG